MSNLGSRLKELRKSKLKTLSELAKETSLSSSFLSQIERSKSSLTIETLMKISEALEVNPSYFFAEDFKKENKPKVTINKSNMFKDGDAISSNFLYESLSGKFLDQTFLPTIVTLQPRKEEVTPLPHKGQEFIYVLSGRLTVVFEGDEEVSLEVGESVHMESTVPHNWINKTKQLVKFLYVSSR